jgi:hypothetical protein
MGPELGGVRADEARPRFGAVIEPSLAVMHFSVAY